MSLGVLVLMVVFGLALAIGAVRYSGLSRPARFSHEGEARAAFALDFPEESVNRAMLSSDGRAAFLDLDGGRTGIVVCFGSKTVARVLSPAETVAVQRDSARLSLRMADFTLPAIQVELANPGQAAELEAALSGRTIRETTYA